MYRSGQAARYASRDPLLAESATPETRGLTYAFYELFDCVGSFMGPLLPILILGFVGQSLRAIRNLFFLSAIPNVISTALVIMLVKETLVLKSPEEGRTSLRGKISMIAENRNLLIFTCLTSVFSLFAMTVDLGLLYITYTSENFTALTSTIMYLFWTGTTVLAALPAGRVVDKRGMRFGVAISFLFHLFSVLAILIYHFILPSIVLVPIAFASLGFYDSFFSVSSKTFVANNASSENRGIVMGLYTTLDGMSKRTFAPIIAGFLYSVYNPATPFLVGLGISIINLMLFARIVKDPAISKE
jgi:MFS family permease